MTQIQTKRNNEVYIQDEVEDIHLHAYLSPSCKAACYVATIVQLV